MTGFGRGVAFLFTVTYCAVLWRNAANFHSLGWPACALGVVVVLAVPLQALFKNLQTWVQSPPGKKLVTALLTKLETTVLGGVTSTASSTTETSTTTTAPAPESPGETRG